MKKRIEGFTRAGTEHNTAYNNTMVTVLRPKFWLLSDDSDLSLYL